MLKPWTGSPVPLNETGWHLERTPDPDGRDCILVTLIENRNVICEVYTPVRNFGWLLVGMKDTYEKLTPDIDKEPWRQKG